VPPVVKRQQNAAARRQAARPAGMLIGGHDAGPAMAEGQRNALPHHADRVDGVDEQIGIIEREVAGASADRHRGAS